MIEINKIEALFLRVMLHLFLAYQKISGTLIDNAEIFIFVMPMYNLIEYSKNYSKTFGTLWVNYKDISTNPITNSESFKYKISITWKTADNWGTKKVEFSVP